MSWTLQIDPLFQATGLASTGEALMNENTYDFDPRDPESSWLYPVILGFKELKRQGFCAETFATIGTGSGIDSVAVFELFQPKKIYQVDVHPNVPEVADYNAKKLIGNRAEIQTFLGDLCEPLVKLGIKADLVYANIPNIPSEEPVWEKKVSASRFMARDLEDCPEVYKKWFLSLQYLFLKQSKQIVKPGAIVVDAIGARVPYEILEKLFVDLGFKVKELVSVYKIQSEPEDTLEGYAKGEQDFGIEYDFYDHENALAKWLEIKNQNFATPQLKEILKPFRINAQQAWKKFVKEGKSSGHVCTILQGQL